jgi:hypothetical protein
MIGLRGVGNIITHVIKALMLYSLKKITLFILFTSALIFLSCSKDQQDDLPNKQRSSEAERLATIGYLGGYREPKEEDTVAKKVLQKSDLKLSSGYNLITSGHAPYVYLLNQKGEIAHSWHIKFEDVFPDYKVPPKNSKRDLTGYIRHATLLPGGDLLVIFEGLALIKIDKNSRVIWAKLNHAHHDLQVLANNDIFILTRKVERHARHNILVDYVTLLNSKGELISEVSLFQAIKDSQFESEIFGNKKLRGDLLHTNSLEQLNEKQARLFKDAQAGDVLISMRNVDCLAIVRPSSKEVVWAFRDIFKQQHYARVSPDLSSLVLFDNYGAKTTSRVLIYSLPDLKFKYRIGAKEIGRGFFTRTLGLAQPLPNGNYLIAESEGGRIYESDKDGKPLWRYSNPHRTGENKKLIATIPHVARVDADLLSGWLSNLD